MLAAVCVSSVVLSSGCGSSSSGAAAPPPATPSPDPGGNPTTLEPLPPPSPSPNPPSPNPPSPTPPSPNPPPPNPSPSPSPDKFVDVERLDGNAECDALVPSSVPAPVTATASGSGPGGCGRGLSEGTGHVAAITAFGRGTQWQVFAPDGHAEQRFNITSDLWPQPEGWQGVQASSSGVPAFATLLSFFADGSPRRSEQPQPSGFSARVSAVAPDPLGGSALILWGPTGNGGCQGELRRFDATGAPAGAPAQVGCEIDGLGVSNAGEALVLESGAGSGGGQTVRWLRADGTVAAPAAKDPNGLPGQLLPLLDGSLVVQQGAVFLRHYPRLATASGSPPAWLAARTNQTFRFTRGNKGYAFFPPPGQNSPDCTQVVELLAPSGRRCAKLTFRRDGNACVTGSIDQGWDGTVVQQTSSGACGWRFWPRLLAGG